MSEGIEFGLTIMAVGMITVFTILGLVVLGGKIMILIINRFTSELVNDTHSPSENPPINPVKISVLAAAVAAYTGGKGKITTIKKL